MLTTALTSVVPISWLLLADYTITKGTITNSSVPTNLHVKFGGLQCLSLTRVNLGLLNYQDLGLLKQLQTLTLTDIGSHLHALQQLLAEHYKWNIATTKKQRNTGQEGMGLKVSLVAATPLIATPAALFNLVSGHANQQSRSLACGAASQQHCCTSSLIRLPQ